MLLEVPPDLVERLELEAAVTAELERPRSMFPSQVVENALAGHEADYAKAVRAQLAGGLDVQQQESVWAPKPGHVGRYRWLTTLPIRERVILRALVLDLGEDVPNPDRAAAAFNAFQAAPLESDHPYIAVGDVASFYFFIDHQLLESRIIEASARADTAETLRAVLAAIGNRAYGLPQNFAPSDHLSDLYISWVERRLTRAGVSTYRHNDDFRLGAATWGEGLQSLELLAEELSRIGLELNGEKSWILSRETYQANLGLAQEIFDQAVPDTFPTLDPYTGDPIDEAGEVDMSAQELHDMSAAVFETAAQLRLAEERMTGFELRANREVLNTALFYFRNVRSPAALEYGPALVAVDPALAHTYSIYLSALADDDTADETSLRVLDVLDRFGGHAPSWLQAWLIEPLLSPQARLNERSKTWLRGMLAGEAPAVLRVRAALGLAANKAIGVDEIAVLFNSLPSAALPDAVAALALLEPDPTDAKVKSIIESGHLYRWIFEFASANTADPRWA
jgi:hypothetical protein